MISPLFRPRLDFLTLLAYIYMTTLMWVVRGLPFRRVFDIDLRSRISTLYTERKGFTAVTMNGAFDQTIVNQVQQANDIVDVISEHISLAKKGREMVGLCPFHEDHRPSLYVNSVKQIFKCFACGAGGDVLKFVQMRENLSFPQAIQRLAERVGIKVQPVKAPKDKTRQPDVDPNRLAKVNAWAARHFQQNLHDKQRGKSTRDYLTKRKIDPESIKKWQLGLALPSGDDLITAAKAKGIPTKLLEQAGLVVGQQGPGLRDKFVNRLMFTITDVTGRVIAFGGRTLADEGAKYINSPTTSLFDKSNSLYGLDHARHQIVSTGTAIVVEGYTDCIMAHSKGFANTVASLGTSFTPGQARILRRYAKQIVLIFDSDTAGIEAANRALEICIAQRIDIKLASVPEGKDPCDFLLSAGRERFEQLLKDAVDVFEFKWNRLSESFTTDGTLVDRKAAIEEFLQTVATSMWAGKLAPIDRGLIVNQLSKIVGLGSKEINAELRKRIARSARAAAYPDTTGPQTQKVQTMDFGQGLFAVAQREILEVLLSKPELFQTAIKQIKADDFDVPILKQIATLLFETLAVEPTASLKAVLAKAESPQISGAIVHLAQAGEEKANFQPRLTGALDAIGRYQAQKRKTEIKEIKDQTRFLQHLAENTGKQNPHNIGMV
jgi:DNA primase